LRARNASKVQSKINMVVYGAPFSGKSTLCSQFAYMKTPEGKPFRVLYLDAETSSIEDYLPELEKNGVKLDNIYICYTQSLEECKQYIEMAKNKDPFPVIDENGEEVDGEYVKDADGEIFHPDAIVLDGASILSTTMKQGIVDFSKKRASVKADKQGIIGDERFVKVASAGIELKDYQTINFKSQDLILLLAGCGLNYVVTCREKEEVQNKLVNGETVSVHTGKKIIDGLKNIDYNTKTILWLHRDDDDYETVKATVVKDRTGVHTAGEILEDPSLLDWQEIITKTAKNKKYAVENTLSDAVKKEKEMFEKENNFEDDSKTDNKSVELDELRSKILKLKKSMNPVVDNKYKTELKKVSLNKNPKNIDDKEALKKMLKIAEDIIKAK